MRKKRLTGKINTGGINKEGLTADGTFFKDGVEMVPASYVTGITGEFQVLPERPRYLTLSDNQVLDRAKQPSVSRELRRETVNAMRLSNEACYNYEPTASIKKQEAVRDSLKLQSASHGY